MPKTTTNVQDDLAITFDNLSFPCGGNVKSYQKTI